MRTVLIAANCSETTSQVAGYAREIRAQQPETVFMVAGVATPAFEPGTTAPALLDIPLGLGLEHKTKTEAIHYAEQAVGRMLAAFHAQGVPAKSVLLTGDPGTEIVRYANRQGVDEIVYGAGHKAARAVADHAGCPVTIIRPD